MSKKQKLRLILAYEVGLIALTIVISPAILVIFHESYLNISSEKFILAALLPISINILKLAPILVIGVATYLELNSSRREHRVSWFVINLVVLIVAGVVGWSALHQIDFSFFGSPPDEGSSALLSVSGVIFLACLLLLPIFASLAYGRAAWNATSQFSPKNLVITVMSLSVAAAVYFCQPAYYLAWRGYHQLRFLNAVGRNKVHTANRYLRWGLNPNFRYGNRSDARGIPVCRAVSSPRHQMVDLLRANGARIEACDLSVAIESPRYLRLMLDAGAEVRPEHLQRALRERDDETVGLLLGTGVELNWEHFQAAAGNPEYVRLLLARGAEPTSGSLRSAIYAEDMESIRLLLAAGIEVSHSHLRAAIGKPEFVRLMLELGAEMRQEHLSWAISRRYLESARILIAAGLEPESEHLMKAIGRPQFVQLLLAAGVKPGCTHMKRAMQRNDKESLRLMQDIGQGHCQLSDSPSVAD